jgi:hypothetical protein
MTHPVLRDHDFFVLRPPIVPGEDVPHGVPGAIYLNGFCYLVHALTDAAFHVTGVRFDGLKLSKAKDWTTKIYTVQVDGPCDCPDAVFRRNQSCKHRLACELLGLIEPSPARHPQTREPANVAEPEYANLPF